MAKLNTVDGIKQYLKYEISRLREINSCEAVGGEGALKQLLNQIEKAEK